MALSLLGSIIPMQLIIICHDPIVASFYLFLSATSYLANTRMLIKTPFSSSKWKDSTVGFD